MLDSQMLTHISAYPFFVKLGFDTNLLKTEGLVYGKL